MVLDLRVKALVRAPTPAQRRNLCVRKLSIPRRAPWRRRTYRATRNGWIPPPRPTVTPAVSPSNNGQEDWYILGALEKDRRTVTRSKCMGPPWLNASSSHGRILNAIWGLKTHSFRVRTNSTITTRNNRIRSSGSKQPLLPDEWGELRQDMCTHGGTYKWRGKGKRKRIQSRAMECEAQICCLPSSYQLGDIVFGWAVWYPALFFGLPLHAWFTIIIWTNARTISPHVRAALEPEVVTKVNELRKAGAKKKRILKYIQENSECNPLTQDVHNMIIATCITLQTGHMRSLFDRFPEVFMIDATHGTNASKYKMLISLLPNDARPRPRMQTFEPGLEVQVDSYNCGIYVLLAFEMFCGAEPLGHLDKKTLQCLHYRYLCAPASLITTGTQLKTNSDAPGTKHFAISIRLAMQANSLHPPNLHTLSENVIGSVLQQHSRPEHRLHNALGPQLFSMGQQHDPTPQGSTRAPTAKRGRPRIKSGSSRSNIIGNVVEGTKSATGNGNASWSWT
ncbi:hypothetical protein F444_07341 [Phytophthora nicotianae P1976]|uniref:ZSWIM1/3 RNaseH-like domain-containing protein n=2 Tax=Phytophthora nicotianae TaxID=4792 RepID=A0A081AF08_PHYNI|nr:hypothetical protein F444_07341 [Phytophthora nicotianae P1976]